MRLGSVAALLALAITLASFAPDSRADDMTMGPMPLPTAEDYYPAKARRLGITGRVGFECSVDEKERARNCVVLDSADPLLDEAAKSFLSRAHFQIPADWAATGGPAKRFPYGVIFRLIVKPEVAGFADNRRVVIITSH